MVYAYNLADQLTSDGVNTYIYDARGNLATINGSPAYTWDRANRLLSYGGSSYTYNGLGQRISQTIGANTTQYLQDVQPALYKILSATTGTNTTRYVHDPMGIHSQENPDGSWSWMVNDGLGSVRHVVDNNANILASAQYAPYGEVWDGSVTAQTAGGFTGEFTDVNGLVYLRARHFNPSLGIFPNLDPLEIANRYSYTSANPINYTDHTGKMRELPWTFSSCWQSQNCGSSLPQIPSYPQRTPTPEDNSYDESDVPLFAPMLQFIEAFEGGVEGFIEYFLDKLIGIDVDVPFDIPFTPFGQSFSGIEAAIYLATLAASATGHRAGGYMRHFLNDTGNDKDVDVDQLLDDLPAFSSRVVLNGIMGELYPIIQNQMCRSGSACPLTITSKWLNAPSNIGIEPSKDDIYPNTTLYLGLEGLNIQSLFTRSNYPNKRPHDWFVTLGGFHYSVGAKVEKISNRLRLCYKVFIYDRYDWDPNDGKVDPILALLDAAGSAQAYDIKGTSSEKCIDISNICDDTTFI